MGFYKLWTRVSLLFLFFGIYFNTETIFPQSILEHWEIPRYQSSDYSDIYGNLYFVSSMEEWDLRMEEILYDSIVSWQTEANRQIEEILIQEGGEDSFVSNEGYVDERRRSLFSEVSLFYSDWERDLMEDYFTNRSAFLEKLETGIVDELYLHRIGKEQIYEEYTQEELALRENREQILREAETWEYQWEKSRQEGLDSFSTSLERLEEDYFKYIQSLQNTENQFITNLQAINQYKETVQYALGEMVSQLKLGLDANCELNSGCQYKNSDGSLNEAGKIFSRFIQELSDELSIANKDPDLMLTQIATKMRDFLSNESNEAFIKQTFFEDRVYTYQTGFELNFENTKTKYDLNMAMWNLVNQTYYQLGSDVRFENWNATPGDVGIFSGVSDPELQSIFQSIHHSDYNRLASILNGKLGQDRKVHSILGANLYTDAFHYLNMKSIAGIKLPFDFAMHVNGNLLLDGTEKYGYWQTQEFITIFTPGIYSYQMGAVGYSVLYEMYDDAAYQSSLYWDSNLSQLKGQTDHFQQRLLPAIRHWETKTKEYSESFDQWSDSKSKLFQDAKLEFESKRMQIEKTKEDWLQKLEEEKRDGWNAWNNLYATPESETTRPAAPTMKIEQGLTSIGNQNLASQFQRLSVFDDSMFEIKLGETSLLENFQKTMVGINQYASVIQMNHELEEFRKSEQTKMINQYTYGLNSASIGDRKLTREESILVGSADYSQLSMDEQKNFGKCYEDPNVSSCKGLLKTDYQVSVNQNTGVVRIGKEIFNGLLAGKNAEGEYTAAKSNLSKQIVFSSIGKIQSNDRKDFFTEWSDEDWKSIQNRKNEITNDFLNNTSTRDRNQLLLSINQIETINANNHQSFLAKKETQENLDSFIQEIAIAYITGGASGVKASLKGKVESAINSELAKVWVKATGGDDSQIQLVSMAFEFMRGRMSAKKISSRDQFVSIQNPIKALETVVGKTLSHTMQVMDKASNGLLSVPFNLAMSGVMAVTKALVGEKRYNLLNEQISGPNKRLMEIKEQEVQMAENVTSQALASATGMPLEIISKLVGDTNGQKKAKQADQRMAKNIVSDFGSQITGAFGGIMKTAIVATGVTEDQIVKTMEDAYSFANAKNLNGGAISKASFGYSLQTLGMQANWTKHQSTFLNIKDKDAVLAEVTKSTIAKQMAENTGIEESIVKQALDGLYGKYQKQKADKKAKTKAIGQTIVNAGSLAITMGSSGVWSGATSALSKMGTVASSVTGGILPATAQVGQILSTTALQTVAGSREGSKGAIAGLINGSLLGVTNYLGKFQSGILKGTMPGLGVNYSKQNGWGGSIGIGNSINNVSLSFSEKGNSSLQMSQAIAKGIQFATDITTNEAWNLGINYNPTGEGPRKDWNFSSMFDLKGSGFSGSIGYTDPNSKLGLTSHLSEKGSSTSSQLHGVSLGTNSEDGFQMDEFNFSNQNINMAQDGSDLTDNNGNRLENHGDSPLSDFMGQLGMVGGVILGGMGLANLLRSRFGGGGYSGVGTDFGSFRFQSSSERSVFSHLTDRVKIGMFRFGESVSQYADAYSPEKPKQFDEKIPKEKTPKELDRIKKLETSVIDDFKMDSRLDTEKKLYELRQAGVDTTDLDAKIKTKRGGKDVPMSKADEKSLSEYKRLRELRSVRPIGSEAVSYVASGDALSKVNTEFNPKTESKKQYLQRLGDAVCAVTKDVDLSTKELVDLHTANVARLLGQNLMGKINYKQLQIIDGKEVVSAVNTVDANGFRQTSDTDCIRYIGAVLHAAGLTDRGSFANLNTDVYLTPEETDRMREEFKAGTIHKNGVEYFRQAGSFSHLVSERITTEKDLIAHTKKGMIPELKPGMIGITRRLEAVENTKRIAMKSDHIYMIVEKRFNSELGVDEYLISESAGGKGVQNRWIRKETNSEILNQFRKRYESEKMSEKEIDNRISKIKIPNNYSDYLLRSEYYSIKPHVSIK